MSTIKRLRAPLVMMFGVTVASVALAMPASAADGVYPPPAGTDVLGTSAPVNAPVAAAAPVAVAGVNASTAGPQLAFTGGTVVGIGALGGLLLAGGATMVVAGRRRKVDA